jgi:argininosuccinate lyase
MSHDPLRSIRRRQPLDRRMFPDPDYLREWLEPYRDAAESLLRRPSNDVYVAHALMLGEQRIVDADDVSRILKHLMSDRADATASVLPHHALSRAQSQAAGGEAGVLSMALAYEEVEATSCRMVLRDRVLDLSEAVIDARESIAELAEGHLTTLMLVTANGQVVQPTSLGHYLAGQLGPMARFQQQLQEALGRLNRSPMGAVSGMSTAMPIRRGRTAELLGFDGVVDNTIDALAGLDVFHEIASTTAGVSTATSRLVADISFWARDDIGLLVPGDEFVHAGTIQPQRRDPLVLDHLRWGLATLTTAPSVLTTLLFGQQGVGGEVARIRAFFAVEEQLSLAARVYRLLAAVTRTAVVNRAMFANRTNRGFSTSSELADLLMIDFELPCADAVALAERVVVEATDAGGDATTLTAAFVDEVALRLLGREIGIEPEMLARCLSPKRFVERRVATGGPAPSAVGQALEREAFSARRDRGWVQDRRARVEAANRGLMERATEVAENPAAILGRPDSPGTQVPDDAGDTI